MRKYLSFRSWHIRTQILVSMQVLMFVLALGCCLASYTAAKSNIERNYKANCEKNLQVIDGIIGMELEDAVTMVRETVVDERFLSIVESENKSGLATYDSVATHRLDDIWLGVENRNDYVGGIFLFDMEGRFYRKLRANRNTSWYAPYYDADILETLPWVEEVAKARGREVFYGYNLLAPETDASSVSFARQIIDPRTYQPVGYLVVQIMPNLFRSSIMTDSDFDSEAYAILDQNNNLIYSSRSRAYVETAVNAYLHNAGGYLFEIKENEVSGFKTLVSISIADLNGISRYVRVMTPLILIASVLMATLLAYLLTGMINKPLKKLKNVVVNLKDGEPITEEFDVGEIGQVGNALKRTIDNNLELRERLIQSRVKEREAELLLLQSQINPHFLYNTLDSIYCKAMIHQQDEIAAMVLALSNLFKVSLNKGKYILTVREELEHVEQYMAIQKLRYKDRFELIVDVDEELMDLHIIKLILQPFVENSVYHGLEPKMGSGYIEIQGERLEDTIYFRILDNGVGMDNPDAIFKGYGVTNVVDRIHLFYGEEYGIRVTTVKGCRTGVEICIPVMKEDLE